MITVPEGVSSIRAEGFTFFPGDQIPDDLLDRHPELKDPAHPLNALQPKADAPKKSKATADADTQAVQ